MTYKAWSMADGGYLLIFRGQPTQTLLDLQAKLLTQMTNLGGYQSQTVGGKSYSARSLAELRPILEAIQFVLNERSIGDYEGVVITDFSEGSLLSGQPAGVTDDLSS